jgi:hypothetical protein
VMHLLKLLRSLCCAADSYSNTHFSTYFLLEIIKWRLRGDDYARQSLGGFYTQQIVVSSSAFRTLAAGDDINVNELQGDKFCDVCVLIVHDFGKEKEREERDPK